MTYVMLGRSYNYRMISGWRRKDLERQHERKRCRAMSVYFTEGKPVPGLWNIVFDDGFITVASVHELIERYPQE